MRTDMEQVEDLIERLGPDECARRETVIAGLTKNALEFPFTWEEIGDAIAKLDFEYPADRVAEVVIGAIDDRTKEQLWRNVERNSKSGNFGQYPYLRAYAYVVRYEIRRIIANGANDTWSGRHNDARRAEFDATRVWISRAESLVY